MRGSAGAARVAIDAVMKVRREMREVIVSSFRLIPVFSNFVERTDDYRTAVISRNLPWLAGNVKHVVNPVVNPA
jgi:hypothetical protein